MNKPDRPFSRYALADALDNDHEAIRLITDMLRATIESPEVHGAGFKADQKWENGNRAGFDYFLGVSGGTSYFENHRHFNRNVVPSLQKIGFVQPSGAPNIADGFWQFTDRALDWYRENSGPSDDEVRKKIGRIIAERDPLNEWSHYQAEELAEEIGISPERVLREVAVLVGGGFLAQRRVSSKELGPLSFARPAGVLWAASDFPPISTVGLHQTTVNVSVSVQVTAIIEQARETTVSKEQLLQLGALLQRAAVELEKPQGKGKYEAIQDLVSFAANIKELVPLVGQFVAENGDKIQGLSDAVGNLLPG